MKISMTNLNNENTRIIIGNPGCGKTTFLINELKKICQEGTELTKIAYCSFSVAAVEEAITRAIRTLGKPKHVKKWSDVLPYFRTLHSMAFHLLGLSPNALMSGAHMKRFAELTQLPISYGIYNGGSTGCSLILKGDEILQAINVARLSNQSIQEYIATSLAKNSEIFRNKIDVGEVLRVAERYEEYKSIEEIYDYTDMLVMAKDGDLDLPILDYLFVDEAQDLSALQWILVNRLAGNAKNIIIAGDDKQTINEFAGADLDTFLSLPGKVETLEQSYRIPNAVYNIANRVMTHMHKFRKEGSVWKPRDEEGNVITCCNLPLSRLLVSDWLILARSKYQLESISERLIRYCADFPFLYTVNGSPPVDMDIFRCAEIYSICEKTSDKCVLDFIAVKDTDTAEEKKMKLDYRKLFKRYVSVPKIHVGNGKYIDNEEEFDKKVAFTPWLQAMDKLPKEVKKYVKHLYPLYQEKGSKMFEDAKVKLMTIHAAKGREATNVILYTPLPRNVAKSIDKTNDDTEAKICYVAVTRAKENLYLYSDRYDNESTLKRYID